MPDQNHSEDTIASSDTDQQPPPLNSRVMGRLFLVPLLIVSMIVGSSVLVVLMFGWITTSQEEPIEKLVARIESGTGDKIMTVALLPRDKEVWQAAMELARRLQSDDPRTLDPKDRPEIARRLEAILERTRVIEQTEMGQEMQRFMLSALGQLKQPSSVDLLVKYAIDEKQPVKVRFDAVGGLVLMRQVQAARDTWPQLAPLLDSSESVLRIIATAAIGKLAQSGDAAAIKALTQAYRGGDREVTWNAALALAGLGSNAAVPMLRDMLDRSYWENIKLESTGGTNQSRKLSPIQVDGYLTMAIDAAHVSGDTSLNPPIEKLTHDQSAAIREHAAKAIQHKSASGSAPSACARNRQFLIFDF